MCKTYPALNVKPRFIEVGKTCMNIVSIDAGLWRSILLIFQVGPKGLKEDGNLRVNLITVLLSRVLRPFVVESLDELEFLALY